jgi:hypothetical protein
VTSKVHRIAVQVSLQLRRLCRTQILL